MGSSSLRFRFTKLGLTWTRVDLVALESGSCAWHTAGDGVRWAPTHWKVSAVVSGDANVQRAGGAAQK